LRDLICAGICGGNRFRVWDVGDGIIILECITCGWKIHLKEVDKKEDKK